MDDKSDKNFYIAFNYLINFTFQRYKLLIKYFKNLSNAFYAKADDLIMAGIKSEIAFDFINKRKKFSFDNIFSQIEQEKINICTINDKNYPFLLKNIYTPPPLFYYKGNLNINWNLSLSVVGSRKFSFYGKKIIEDFMPFLVNSGINIISGLAIGIDSLAHQTVLDCGGQTIAVLGSGLDYNSIYPYQNRYFIEEILEKNGLIISEFPLETKPISYNFPKRNRIIAGLSMATLVVEAGKKSGSLITAKYAIDEGREVLAIPGDIYNNNSLGTNILIKNGAQVIIESDDILNFFNIFPKFDEDINKNKLKIEYNPQNEKEKLIIDVLKNGPHHIDNLSEILKNNISEIGSTLVLLELRGVIRDLGGKNYVLS